MCKPFVIGINMIRRKVPILYFYNNYTTFLFQYYNIRTIPIQKRIKKYLIITR